MSDYLLVFVPKKPIFSKSVLDRLASIFSDIAQISLASVAIPVLLNQGDTVTILLGSIGSLFFWLVSIYISANIKS